MKTLSILSVVACLVPALACGANNNKGGEQSSKNTVLCGSKEALVARPSARLLLSDEMLQSLRERAAAQSPEWTALAKLCDDHAGATIESPSGAAYPDYPNIGAGYQGDEYLDPMAALGLCYRVTAGTDDAAAARYAAAGEKLLVAMSTPTSEGGADPSTDSGYGIRWYGVSMALGFDWLYPAITDATKQRVITALNNWVDWYDASGFLNDQPVANYFAGYFLAKTLTALGTEGDNQRAGEYWSDLENRIWPTMVKPALDNELKGGGWPEGWNYGPRAVRNFAEALWAAKTAHNADWLESVSFVADEARYVRHFSWPALDRMDDQGTVRAGVEMKPSAALASELATLLEQLVDPSASDARSWSAKVANTAGDDRNPWEAFMFSWGGTDASYTSDQKSDLASGMGHVAFRSSWDATATWGALSGGAYVDAVDSGEQLYNAGGLSVVSGTSPVLVNATGWIPFTGGSDGENYVYDDNYGQYTRKLYNTFFVDDAANPFNPGQNSAGPTTSQAHIDAFEDQDAFVRARAVHLEDQYGDSESHPVKEFTRDVVFVRPGVFVIADRTEVASAGADQWLSFHVPEAPLTAPAADATQNWYDIQFKGQTNGGLATLLPRSARMTSTSLPGGSVRLEAHLPVASATARWLTVVTAGASLPELERLSGDDANVTSKNAVGVSLHTTENAVVLFANDGPATSFDYKVTPSADARHIVVGVDPSEHYAVTATRSGGELTVAVRSGGDLAPSEGGVLSFKLALEGDVTATPPAPTATSTDTSTATTTADPATAEQVPTDGDAERAPAPPFADLGSPDACGQ